MGECGRGRVMVVGEILWRVEEYFVRGEKYCRKRDGYFGVGRESFGGM